MIDVRAPTPLLGGLSPRAFMRRHWQRQPLLVRGAWPGVVPPLQRRELFALAAAEDVESRLVRREAGLGAKGRTGTASWTVRHGPLPARALPPLSRPGWTLLVQGLDLHVSAAHDMLAPFRFIPAARLDDLMVSWASDGGGVGPHTDSYDVFLLQVQGRRRWRVAPPEGRGEPAFVEGLPLKILSRFAPVHDWVLEPGDMLYLPPGWGHDGVAVGGDCMTCSVGFRAPGASEIARELLLRLADECSERGALYADAGQVATDAPGAVPAGLERFAARALAQALRDPKAAARALGEVLTEPKPQVWFEGGGSVIEGRAVRLDARTRMLYDGDGHLFINGESVTCRGRDGTLLRRLADERALSGDEVARLGPSARRCLHEWAEAGWLHGAPAAANVGRPRARAIDTTRKGRHE